MPDVVRPGHPVHERRDVGGATDLVELPRAAELLCQRDEIDRPPMVLERDHLVEDEAVRVPEEVLRLDDLDGVIDDVVAQEDGAENGSFSVEIVRERAIDGTRVGHGRGPWSLPADAVQHKSVARRGSGTRRSLEAARSGVVLDDLNENGRDHVAMQLDRHRMLAKALDRLRQLDLPAVDLDPLPGQNLGDVR